MRCETARSLGRRMPQLGAWLIRRHILKCRHCRELGDLEIRSDAFFQAGDFENEDLWPAVSGKIALPQAAIPKRTRKTGSYRNLPGRRPVPRLRPAHAGAAILIFAAVAGAVYFGIPALRDTLVRDPREAPLTAEHPGPSETAGLQASIDAAFVRGRTAKVFIYIQPKNTTMSFFWIEPQKDPDNDKRSKGEDT